MTSAVVSAGESPGKPELAADLESVGIHVVGLARLDSLVQEVLRSAPDLVVCYEAWPSEELFATALSLRKTAPRPVVVFTTDSDADKIERATQSGIHAYVINGYGLSRLRSVLHLAQARFQHDEILRKELEDLAHRYEERKLLDRAKGILMRARQISEDDAFKILRTASMQSNQRMGLVSQQVIHAAHYADAVNRSGQLRMLSQRLVKLCALTVAEIEIAAVQAWLADSVARVDRNLAVIAKSLSKATFGDLIALIEETWKRLQQSVTGPLTAPKLQAIDASAELLLKHAEQLTAAVEVAGFTSSLHVINISGRQRMLSQRLAKQALLGVLLKSSEAARQRAATGQTIELFEQSLKYLNEIPLSSKMIRAELARVEENWKSMRAGVVQVGTEMGRTSLATSSEALLESFEQLTDQYERSMQTLIG